MEAAVVTGSAAPMGWLVLSPHLDDAALSVGGTLARLAAGGETVCVVTAFAGDEPQPAPSPLGAGMVRGWGFPPGRAMAGRRAEDAEACRALGLAAPHHLGHREAIHRCDGVGRPLYPTLAALFGEPAEADGALLDGLVAELRGLPPAAHVLAPLGVGGHVDHRLLRAAAERAFGAGLLYFEEYPYSRDGAAAVEPALGTLGGWRHQLVALAPADVGRKAAAIAAYRSQVRHLFRGDVGREVAAQARHIGGERLWRRARPPGPRP